jgi:uncharacterized protein YndB with AHSA1/START domain
MHATYENVSNRPTLRFERRLAHPVTKVWRAITEPAELRHWFPSTVEGEIAPGGALSFGFEHMPLEDGPTSMEGRVTDFDPPRLFAFYWGDDHLRFELEPVEPGACLLRFTVMLDAEDKAARDAAGWHQCLDGLERQLGDAPPERPMPSDAWRTRYEEYSRRGLPTGAPVPDQ